MADENDKFWMQAQRDLRRAVGLTPLTPEQAEKECKQTKAIPMSDQDIDSVMEFVQSWGEKGGLGSPAAAIPEKEVSCADAEDIDAETLALVNRNKGEQDDESEKLLKKHRTEALGNGKQTENQDGDNKNQNGSGGGTDTAGTGG